MMVGCTQQENNFAKRNDINPIGSFQNIAKSKIYRNRIEFIEFIVLSNPNRSTNKSHAQTQTLTLIN